MQQGCFEYSSFEYKYKYFTDEYEYEYRSLDYEYEYRVLHLCNAIHTAAYAEGVGRFKLPN